MNENRVWSSREQLDMLWRIEVMRSSLEFAFAWAVLLFTYLSALEVGLGAWVIGVWALLAVLTLPVALAELQVILDAVYHVVTGRSGFLLAQLQQMASELSAPTRPIAGWAAVYVRLVRVLAWFVPWRPLAKVALAYLARTRTITAFLVELREAELAASKSRPVNATATQEMIAVKTTPRRVGRDLEDWVSSSFPSRFGGMAVAG